MLIYEWMIVDYYPRCMSHYFVSTGYDNVLSLNNKKTQNI